VGDKLNVLLRFWIRPLDCLKAGKKIVDFLYR